MKALINWIAEMVQLIWNLFCMAPVTGILLVIVFIVMAVATYYFIKDIVCTDKGGPIILR